MRLARILIENFRVFGAKNEGKNLDLPIQPGLNLLAGENESGKTAVTDALRLILGTTSLDFMRVTEDDFHKSLGGTAIEFTIYCRFEDLSDDEAARFLEWLSLEDINPVLELTLRANRTDRRNKKGISIPFIEYMTSSGPNGTGRALDGSIRSFLWLTYLKPLRDAEMEMAAGKGSRLSQLLISHPALRGQEVESEMPTVESGKPPSPPETLRGIMAIAEKWIQQSPAIKKAKEQLNKDYLENLSVGANTLAGEIAITRRADLKSILEKLELWLKSGDQEIERTRHGLGINNVLFMAAELLLLNESIETGLPLLVIEEPEAHLHPQLQIKLMEFLEEKTQGDATVQVIVTTHSPNLASKAKIENITLMASGCAYPLV